MSTGQDLQLCEILIRNGSVHLEQITEALELQKIRPKRVGELLLDLGYVEEEQILQGLSEQFNIPFVANLGDEVDSSLTTKVPISFIREYHMVPYKKNGTGFLVAVNDPVNLLPLDDLRLLLGGPVSPVLCS